jgi:hypothetical protein
VFGIIALVAVIGLAFIACDDPEAGEDKFIVNETSGRLTITGIPAEYNGKWISGQGNNSDLTFYLSVGSGFTDNGRGDDWPLKGVQIANGTATLKVWKHRREEQKGGYVHTYRDNYAGNDSGMLFNFSIADTETGTGISRGSGVTVNFSNGIASGAFVPD